MEFIRRVATRTLETLGWHAPKGPVPLLTEEQTRTGEIPDPLHWERAVANGRERFLEDGHYGSYQAAIWQRFGSGLRLMASKGVCNIGEIHNLVAQVGRELQESTNNHLPQDPDEKELFNQVLKAIRFPVYRAYAELSKLKDDPQGLKALCTEYAEQSA